jgi:hypothetical protein
VLDGWSTSGIRKLLGQAATGAQPYSNIICLSAVLSAPQAGGYHAFVTNPATSTWIAYKRAIKAVTAA